MKTITDKFGQKGQQISITVVSNEKACLFAQLMLSDVNPVKGLMANFNNDKARNSQSVDHSERCLASVCFQS